jgi:hypothetical protein
MVVIILPWSTHLFSEMLALWVPGLTRLTSCGHMLHASWVKILLNPYVGDERARRIEIAPTHGATAENQRLARARRL